MTCPTCRQQLPPPPDTESVALLCELCEQPFRVRGIVALCPACAQHQPNHISGQVSGT